MPSVPTESSNINNSDFDTRDQGDGMRFNGGEKFCSLTARDRIASLLGRLSTESRRIDAMKDAICAGDNLGARSKAIAFLKFEEAFSRAASAEESC